MWIPCESKSVRTLMSRLACSMIAWLCRLNECLNSMLYGIYTPGWSEESFLSRHKNFERNEGPDIFLSTMWLTKRKNGKVPTFFCPGRFGIKYVFRSNGKCTTGLKYRIKKLNPKVRNEAPKPDSSRTVQSDSKCVVLVREPVIPQNNPFCYLIGQ